MLIFFCSRWNNYKSNNGSYLFGDPCMQEHVFEHFNSESYWFFNVTVIDKTNKTTLPKGKSIGSAF